MKTKVREKRGEVWVPVFPGLEASFVEKEMKGFPVVENLVTVVDDVGGGTHVPQHSQGHKRKEPTQPFVALFSAVRFVGLVQLRVRRWRRIRRWGPSLPRGHGYRWRSSLNEKCFLLLVKEMKRVLANVGKWRGLRIPYFCLCTGDVIFFFNLILFYILGESWLSFFFFLGVSINQNSFSLFFFFSCKLFLKN